MRPASSSARTRRRHGGAERPILVASAMLVMRPSACSSFRMRQSMASRTIGINQGSSGCTVAVISGMAGEVALSESCVYVEPLSGLDRRAASGQNRAMIIPTDQPRKAAERPLEGLSAWVISDGKAGHEIQCLGVAEALGLKIEVKHIPPPGRLYKVRAPVRAAAARRALRKRRWAFRSALSLRSPSPPAA